MSGNLHQVASPGSRWVRLAGTLALLAAALPAAAAIPAGERQALTSLYVATRGGAWTSNTNWCSGACPASGTPTFNSAGSECNWYGITCDAGLVHVVAIALPHNNLSGALPSLSALGALRYLSLVSNDLSGPIPAFTGLSQLQTLYLSGNRFSGSIPALSGLVALSDIALAGNQLDGTIPSLTGLSALASVDLSGNRFTGSLPSLSGLSHLRTVDVSRNQLDGTLPAISTLPLLRFAVDHNRFSGTIPALPPSLSDVQLGDNRLTGAVPAAPVALYTPRAFVASSLCPNPLTTTPTANDAGWNLATGFSAWWQNPYAGNRCDDLFSAGFD